MQEKLRVEDECNQAKESNEKLNSELLKTNNKLLKKDKDIQNVKSEYEQFKCSMNNANKDLIDENQVLKIKIDKIKKKLEGKEQEIKNNKQEYESKFKILVKEKDNSIVLLDQMKIKLSEAIQ